MTSDRQPRVETRQENKAALLRRLFCLLAALSVSLPCALSQASVTVGLYFVEGQDEPIDFLNFVPVPTHFIQPWQMTGSETQFVNDGAFFEKTEQEVRDAVISGVKEKFYSIPTPAGYVLDIDFLPQKASGPGSVNVLLGKHNIEQPWLGRAMVGAGLGEINGEIQAAVSIDRIDSNLAVDFTEFDYGVNAVANVTAHEVGHLFGLEHVYADEGIPGWEPGDPVVTNPYDVMADTSTGLPDSGWLQNNIFTTVPGTQSEGGHSSVSLLIEQVGLRLIGDTDHDNDVDGSDLTESFGAFTGSGGTGKTWFDGDTDFDGDVDGADLTTSFGAFTASSAGNLITSEDFADLIYNSVTGNVELNALGAPGDVITSFALENDADTFIPGAVILPWNAFLLSEATVGAISDIDTGGTGFSGIWDLGNVMPTGMDLIGLEAYLSNAIYAGTVGDGSFEFDLVVVPEPGSITLLMIGACGLLTRRRRR